MIYESKLACNVCAMIDAINETATTPAHGIFYVAGLIHGARAVDSALDVPLCAPHYALWREMDNERDRAARNERTDTTKKSA